jgi:c-di-GMP-binding flagellar brake protein YcgR
MFFLLVAIFIGLGVFVVISQSKGGLRFPWLQFYVHGKESGFKFREIHLLRRIAVENRLPNPTSLFWSERQLDRCIKGTIIKFRSLGRDKDERAVSFLNKLFEFRKRVEFNLPKYRLGIQSSRQVAPAQFLKINLPGGGVFQSQVVENMRKYLAISYPQGKALPPGYTWHGQKMNVYFWRKEDAGYYFESKVIGDYLDRKYPILHIAHSDNLTRAQKRGSVRVELSTPANIYPLKTISQANEVIESSSGYKGKMLDMSEDGAAVLVGGKTKPGLPIKLQFNLNDSVIVLCGTVKGVNNNQKNNQSILHIQAAPPSPIMRNIILTYVYGLFREPETDRKDQKKPVGQVAPTAAPTAPTAGAASATGQVQQKKAGA